jgi:hypothetical protein
LAAETGFITRSKDELLGLCRGVDPRIQSEIIPSHCQVVTRRVDEDVAAAIEIERLPNLAGRVTLGALPGAIVVVLQIVGRAIARPPILQVAGRRRADAAFAYATRIDDCLNFRLRKRPAKDLYFVDLSLPEVSVRWASYRD